MGLRRGVEVLGGLAAGILVAATAGADVDYVDYDATYRKAAAQALPPGVASYQVTVDVVSGIRSEQIVIAGMARVDADADLDVRVSASRPEIVDATLQSFTGQIAVTSGGQAGPPYFDYTIYWHDIVLAQNASVSIASREGGWPVVESPPLGETLRRDTGKPDAMRTGIFQACLGPRCVMQNENSNSADSAERRANYLAETFSTDVARNGFAVVTNGRARAEHLLADIHKFFEENPENPAAGMTTENINRWLEANYGVGDRTLKLALAVAHDDSRFNEALARLGAGDDVDRTTRRGDAMEALRAVVADERVSARTRAAAMYNLAALQGIEGQLTDALETLRLAELENLKQPDRRLRTKHGQILTGRMAELRQLLSERTPALAAAPVGTDVPGETAATAEVPQQ